MSRVVLVVDDEQGIVAVLSRLLADEGWTVHGAHDGAEALLLIGRTAPSVVLVDYVMPLMDGAALVKALRRDPAGRAIKVVVMSGLSETMIARKVKHYDGFIQKPFAFADLVRVLDRCAPPEKRGRRSSRR